MKLVLAILLIVASFKSTAQPLAGLKVAIPNFSMELELVVDQLSTATSLNPQEALALAQAAALINNDLSKTPRSNALFMIKSEIYKGLLNNPLLSKNSDVLLNESLVKGIEEKLKDRDIVYTDFSKWVMGSILLDLAPYRKKNFLDHYQTTEGNDVKQRAKALEVRKLGRYLSPWLVAFTEKTPEEFNLLSTEVCSGLIQRIAAKSYFFKEFSSKYSQEALGKLFIVPKISEQNSSTEALSSSSIKEESKRRKEQGEKTIKALEKGEAENPSQAIDKLLELESEDGWKPK